MVLFLRHQKTSLKNNKNIKMDKMERAVDMKISTAFLK